MATVVPSVLPRRATAGEKRLHSILGKLPGDCVVYYEPDFRGRRPDFVILSPRLGVVLIEDKNWYATTLWGGNRNRLDIAPRDKPKQSVQHPAEQVRKYWLLLEDMLGKEAFATRFLQMEGEYAGQLRFPRGRFVTLSNITRSNLVERRHDVLFDPKTTVTRDEIDVWEALSDTALEVAIRERMNVWFPFVPFTDDEMKALRRVVHPEVFFDQAFRMDDLLSSPKPIDEKLGMLKVLDLKQEDCARSLGDGHRILYGVAGSGKTVILLVRARLLAAAHPNRRILVTCFNKMLAAKLQTECAGFANIDVIHFHGLAVRNGAAFDRDDAVVGDRFLAALASGSRDAGRYDAVLVDEAQDFEPNWFRCILGTMKDPVDGDLLIVADGAQGLYRRSKLSWKELGIRAQGRTVSKKFDLNRNYRNSSEILALAGTFASRAATGNEDGIAIIPIDFQSCRRSTGTSPVLWREADRDAELDRACGIVAGLLRGEWEGRRVAPLRPSEIAVLYPSADAADKKRLEDAEKSWADRLGVSVRWKSRSGAFPEAAGEALSIQTIHSSKGLQFRAVVVVWTGKLPSRQSPECSSADRRLLYVGMTRAESFLALTASGSGVFADEIADCPAVEVRERRRPEVGILAS